MKRRKSLCQEETNTVILRKKGADTTADLAAGYKPVSYEDIDKQWLYSKNRKTLYAYSVAAEGEPVIVPGQTEKKGYV